MARAWAWSRRSWELVGSDLPVFSLAAFIVVSLSVLSLFILALPLLAGLGLMFSEKLRGRQPTLSQLWEGVTTRFPASLHVWVLYLVTAMPFDLLTFYLVRLHGPWPMLSLVPFLGSLWLVATVTFFSLPLIVDRDLGGLEAIRLSWTAAQRDWRGTLALAAVCLFIGLLGLFACCAGIILTLPLAVGTQMLAYTEGYGPR